MSIALHFIVLIVVLGFDLTELKVLVELDSDGWLWPQATSRPGPGDVCAFGGGPMAWPAYLES